MFFLYEVLTDMAAILRCYPLFVQHAPASTVFALNLTFSSYEEFQEHLES